MISAQRTAMALVAILKRSEQQRARISARTIKRVGNRKHLRSAFVAELTNRLADYSWTLSELDSGGYAAIRTKALESAKSATAKKWLTMQEQSAIRRGDEAIWDKLEKEVSPEQEQPDEDEEE